MSASSRTPAESTATRIIGGVLGAIVIACVASWLVADFQRRRDAERERDAVIRDLQEIEAISRSTDRRLQNRIVEEDGFNSRAESGYTAP